MTTENEKAENAEEKSPEEVLVEAELRHVEKTLAFLEQGAALSVAKNSFGKR